MIQIYGLTPTMWWWAATKARFRRSTGVSNEELIQRGFSNNFNVQNAMARLKHDSKIGAEEGMNALRQWIEEQGGAPALTKLVSPPPGDRDVESQVLAAGGDEKKKR